MKRLALWVALAAPAFGADPVVPVVVATVDISAGTAVTMEMITQRNAEPAMVTASVVKPDSASYVVNQKTRLPILAGDVLLWSFFETKPDDVRSKCAAALASPDRAEAQVARHRDVVRKK